MTEHEQLMYASHEDISFFFECIKGLPDKNGMDGTGFDKFGAEIPFSCGPHSVWCMREIVKEVSPKRMLEVGFNHGHSASIWLALSSTLRVVSCDISYKDETTIAAKMLKKKYKSRFNYMNRNESNFESTILLPSFYDTIFIDGSHLLADVEIDLKLAIDLNIPYIIMDDWLPQFGEIQIAVKNFCSYVEVMKIHGNIALLKNTTFHE